jgi:hypothetical protein
VKLKDIKQLKADAEKHAKDTKEHVKLMLDYHVEMGEYCDSKIGSISNRDEYYTKEWEKHNVKCNEYFFKLKKMEKKEAGK